MGVRSSVHSGLPTYLFRRRHLPESKGDTIIVMELRFCSLRKCFYMGFTTHPTKYATQFIYGMLEFETHLCFPSLFTGNPLYGRLLGMESILVDL